MLFETVVLKETLSYADRWAMQIEATILHISYIINDGIKHLIENICKLPFNLEYFPNKCISLWTMFYCMTLNYASAHKRPNAINIIKKTFLW